MTKQQYIIEQQLPSGGWMMAGAFESLTAATNYFRQLCLDNFDTTFRLTAHATY